MLESFGRYVLAAVEYGGLYTVYSVKRGTRAVTGVFVRNDRVRDDSESAFSRTVSWFPKITVQAGKYTIASIEYAGVLSYSFLKKVHIVTKIDTSRIVSIRPVEGFRSLSGSISESGKKFYRYIRTLTPSIGVDKEALQRIEDKLESIEKRLINIEKNGIMMQQAPKYGEKPRSINEDQKMLLKSILQTNLDLRE